MYPSAVVEAVDPVTLDDSSSPSSSKDSEPKDDLYPPLLERLLSLGVNNGAARARWGRKVGYGY